jgi:2-polyprenyl-3-methyl-5-hydroxy-6-metoxy-1,4-benzoquinol methylase
MSKINKSTVEKQYNFLLDIEENKGDQKLGLMSAGTWIQDPKRLTFVLSRYKFVSKMLDSFENVLEVGCGDGFASRVVRQNVKSLTAVDFDPIFIDNAKEIVDDNWNIDFKVHDMMMDCLDTKFDALYALDVLEHIPPEKEDIFLKNCIKSLNVNGVAIFGMPSLESQLYASKASKEGHVNCKSGAHLKQSLEKYFAQVFIFSMNDEVLHTGFYPMSSYLLALCVLPSSS